MPSSTSSPTRRRLLRSTAALLGAGALAGCGGHSGASGSSSVSGPGAEPPADALVDPTAVKLRNPELKPVVSTGTETTTKSDDQTETPIDDWRHTLVGDAETAASLSFADVDGADEAKALLEETDFESQSVYVERHAIGECYERRLCWVRWTEHEIETDYARILRDADVACEADARDVVTYLIRIPVALDPEQVNSYSSGSGSGPCRTPTDGEVKR
ncbi:hypothetical protein [Halobellus inordinatus]|uniref:hypothetical protein n=1 Tax=Halobellus inordinatus TaxID=1126236 RepID=UPI00210C7E88|nr:hypothetical protein [Halobellus inordinatus]